MKPQAKIFIHDDNMAEANRYIIEQACHFYLNELLPIKQRRMTINFYFNQIIDGDENLKSHAELQWIDTNILPNVYQIRYSPLITKNILRIIKIMAHEMIHIKQFAKGELYDHKYKLTYRWKKTNHSYENESTYWQTPWEIEAYEKEFPLFKKFMKKYGLKQKEIRQNPIETAEKIRKVLASSKQ